MGEKFNNEQEERQFRQFQEYQKQQEEEKKKNVKKLAIRLRWLFSFINIDYCRYFSMYRYYYRWIRQ